MVELVYTVDLKSTAERIVGSSPTGGTKELKAVVEISGMMNCSPESNSRFLHAPTSRESIVIILWISQPTWFTVAA